MSKVKTSCYFQDRGVKLYHNDCLDILARIPDNSIHAVVTDPPYGLSFMGKNWDKGVPGKLYWENVLRVVKPGSHMLCFGGTRTFHRLACAIEDAGWEIRDTIGWVYSQGFPKSMDISKAIDKKAGAKRQVVGVAGKSGSTRNCMAGDFTGGEYLQTLASTDEAKKWNGYGSALKPSHEPVLFATKPSEEKENRLTIISDLVRLESQLCLLLSNAMVAEITSQSSLAVKKLLAIAQWTAVDRTSIRADLLDQMDTSQCELAIRFCLNTVSLWKSIWEDDSVPTNMFTTVIKSSMTIGWQTLKSCLSALTPHYIIQVANNHGGSWLNAVPAAAIFNAVSVNTKSTHTLFVLASVIEKGHMPYPDAIDKHRIYEPILLCRKPLIGTLVDNVLEHGTGGLNIDRCRVSYANPKDKASALSGDAFKRKDTSDKGWSRPWMNDQERIDRLNKESKLRADAGRWPANIIHDGSDKVLEVFPDTGSSKQRIGKRAGKPALRLGEYSGQDNVLQGHNDSGSASRFFYCAKASKKDRGQGNNHPTVKPLALMQYLVKLICPPGGIVLDPFNGSGSTGIACVREGFKYVGIEKEEAYCKISQNRFLEEMEESND